MHDLTTTDLDHVNGGTAATPAQSQSTPIDKLRVPPDVDTSLQTVPPFRGGPIRWPHLD